MGQGYKTIMHCTRQLGMHTNHGLGWICIQIIGTYGSCNQIKGGGWACTHIVANVVVHVITLWGHDDQASQWK